LRPGPERLLLAVGCMLYELHATLLLHFAQEEESYFTLADDASEWQQAKR
jgi:hypothetical protein